MVATEHSTTPNTQRGFTLPLALRFFLATAVLIALAVGAAIFVTYTQGQRIAAQAVDKALTTSVAVQKEFEQSRLDQLQLKVGQIAADASFVKYVADATGANTLPGLGGEASSLPGLGAEAAPDKRSIRDLVSERQVQFGFDLGVLLDGKGDVLTRTDQNEAFSESLASDALVAPALKEAKPFSGYWRQGDKLYQAAIMPLEQDQNLVGFLILALSVDDTLSRKVAQVSSAEVAFWLPHDKDLQLVASSLDAAQASELKQALAKQAATLDPAVRSGKTLDRVALHFAGQDWVAKIAPTAAPGEGQLGAVMALASSDQIVASYRAILNWVMLAGLASMIAALLLSLLFSKQILKPVRVMAKAAEDAAAGNYATRVGIEGKDDLARLARSFDSLLSDLREKSDMEGYVGNLARFLPEPGQEGGAPVVELRTQPMPMPTSPPKRDAAALLGLEFRHLLALPPEMSAEQAVAASARVRELVEPIAASLGGFARHSGGARWLMSFHGVTRGLHALQAWRAVSVRVADANLPDAAGAVAEGDVVSVDGGEVLGAVLVQIDRLLCEAAPGQVLIARNAAERLKGEFGATAVAIANGGFSGKNYYALQPALLPKLPVQAPVLAPADQATVAHGSVAATGVPAPMIPRATSRTDLTQLAPGSTLGGRYRVLSVLGAGGMGVVYKAHDLELDDVVALKMLKPGALLDAEQLDRLKSEIKLARKITHPNVLRTFDFGEVNGIPYISMEYVRGLTLRYLLREAKRVPYSAGLRIARQLVAGLGAAHEVGVLHRDIKPENLILEANGNAKLMDFGIARPARRTQAGHTQPGTFLGTPNYCAPEQLAGEEVDERADIYACGVLMTEMFCGGLPFSGNNTMDIYMAQMQQEPTKPSDLWPEIRPELEAVILRCLKRVPTERYASAAELGAALGQLRA